MFRTARQRKTLCRDCHVARVADILGDSCSILIMRDLLENPMRYGELQKSLAGISSRTLTIKLRSLEKEGMVIRKKIGKIHPHERYSLTKKGRAFHNVMDAMRKYGKKYL